tara:strand:- start:446 stop:661 length:216 start_codon:yes stop_codon:yes gene_type:complete
MLSNRPYEIFAMSSNNSNLISKKRFQITLDFDVYEDFNPYEIQWNKLFQIEGQEQLDVNIKDISDIDIDNW